MATNESLEKILDKSHEQMPLKDLVNESPAALQGLTDKKAELLKEALGVKTIGDLATNKFILWAQAINTLSGYEKLPEATSDKKTSAT